MTNLLSNRSSPTSAGALLRLIREEVAVTRADLARETGLARSTVAQRVDALLGQPGEVIARWDTFSVEHRRQIIATVIDRVVVSPVPAGRSLKAWHPDRVRIIPAP